jgi:hypothetical protein
MPTRKTIRLEHTCTQRAKGSATIMGRASELLSQKLAKQPAFRRPIRSFRSYHEKGQFLSPADRASTLGDVMRKLIMLGLIGAAVITVGNTYAASTGTPTYEDPIPAHARLAQIQAILDDEDSDDPQDDEDFQDDEDLQDDLMDPDGGGDIEDDPDDQDDSAHSSGDGTTPT